VIVECKLQLAMLVKNSQREAVVLLSLSYRAA